MSILSVRDVTVRYGEGRRQIVAVDGVSLEVPRGGVVGLVGESGSGKSTLAKAIVGLVPLVSGAITLDGEDITDRDVRPSERRRRVQMVFQDPYSSLDPRMTVGESMTEALTVRRRLTRAERRSEVARLLDLVSLDPAVQAVLPRQLSGGQLQRVSIARALAADPRLLIADEITSSLDVSVQGSVLNVVREVRAELGLSMLFISHNVAVVRYISDIIAVMNLGQIVEVGPTDELLAAPHTRSPRSSSTPSRRRRFVPHRPESATDRSRHRSGRPAVHDSTWAVRRSAMHSAGRPDGDRPAGAPFVRSAIVDAEDGLEVDDRRSVDRFERLDTQPAAVDSGDRDAVQTDRVGAVLAAQAEHTDRRQRRVVARDA